MINSCLWLSGLLWGLKSAVRISAVKFTNFFLLAYVVQHSGQNIRESHKICEVQMQIEISDWLLAHVETSAFNVFFTPLFFKIRQGNTLRCSKIMCPVKTNNILGIMIQIPKCDQIGTESRDYSARGLGVSCVFLPTQRRLAVYIYPSWFYDPLLACTTCS